MGYCADYKKFRMDTEKIKEMRKRALLVGDKSILKWCDNQLKRRGESNA